jgi:hypothetical protein
VGEVGEAVVRGNAATDVAEEALRCLAEEAVVLQFGVSAGNRVLIAANLLRRVPAGQPNLAVVQAVVPQLAAQCKPERPRNEVHGAPCRCVQDC